MVWLDKSKPAASVGPDKVRIARPVCIRNYLTVKQIFFTLQRTVSVPVHAPKHLCICMCVCVCVWPRLGCACECVCVYVCMCVYICQQTMIFEYCLQMIAHSA